MRGFLAIPKVLRNSATRQLMEKHRDGETPVCTCDFVPLYPARRLLKKIPEQT